MIKPQNTTARRSAAFTLIELMIVIAIVAILAAIAYPSYLEHMRKAGRAEGKAALMRAAQMLERYYTANGTYPNNALGTAYGGALVGNNALGSGENPSQPGRYVISMTSTNPGPNTTFHGYTLTATPSGPSAPQPPKFDDPVCGNLTLTSTGVRGYTSASGTPQQCW